MDQMDNLICVRKVFGYSLYVKYINTALVEEKKMILLLILFCFIFDIRFDKIKGQTNELKVVKDEI